MATESVCPHPNVQTAVGGRGAVAHHRQPGGVARVAHTLWNVQVVVPGVKPQLEHRESLLIVGVELVVPNGHAQAFGQIVQARFQIIDLVDGALAKGDPKDVVLPGQRAPVRVFHAIVAGLAVPHVQELLQHGGAQDRGPRPFARRVLGLLQRSPQPLLQPISFRYRQGHKIIRRGEGGGGGGGYTVPAVSCDAVTRERTLLQGGGGKQCRGQQERECATITTDSITAASDVAIARPITNSSFHTAAEPELHQRICREMCDPVP